MIVSNIEDCKRLTLSSDESILSINFCCYYTIIIYRILLIFVIEELNFIKLH